METILEFKEVKKSYVGKVGTVPVLHDISMALSRGVTAAVVGPSGSGKTTLLSLAAGLERPDSGEVVLCGQTISTATEEQRTALRAASVGFVFQTFELIPTLTALENVMVPAELLGKRDAATTAEQLLQEVGLSKRTGHLPSQLSGGERQRVAIARAFINEPAILFADEPTGNLDRRSAEQITELLFRLNTAHQTTLLVATHDRHLAERCALRFEFDEDGQLFDQAVNT